MTTNSTLLKYFCAILMSIGLFYNSTMAQTISNVRARVEGDKVIVIYDLIESEPGQLFKIKLKSSKDNYTLQLVQVSGNGIGEEVSPGDDKVITWYPKDELGYRDFTGSLLFKVVGSVSSAPLKIINPIAKTKQKRGKHMTLVYSGGKSGEALKIDLLKGGVLVKTFGQSENSNPVSLRGIKKKYIELGENYKFKKLKIPSKGIKKGKDYRVRITSVQRPENYVESSRFKIKKKTPWLFRKLPLLAVMGGAYYYYITYVDVDAEETDLPGDPGTPN